MKTLSATLLLPTLSICTLLLAACATQPKMPRRTLSDIAGPERVFAQPVADLFPQLVSATATGVDGRVGDETVFWGYRLQDNSNVNLAACALLAQIDCEARLRAVCPAGGQELARLQQSGTVRELNCRAVGVANVGELYPNCEDREISNDLMVGLIACH